MYQVKYQQGYSLVVIGNAARIDDQNSRIVYRGSYDDCLRWLRTRNLMPSGN